MLDLMFDVSDPSRLLATSPPPRPLLHTLTQTRPLWEKGKGKGKGKGCTYVEGGRNEWRLLLM